MKKDVAEQIEPKLREAFALINTTMAICKDQDSEDVFEAYREEAGQAMGRMYALMQLVYKAHPDLLPNSYKSKQS